MGKPGSKRYNRWEGGLRFTSVQLTLSEYRLRKFLSDTESSLSESDPDFDKGFDETYEPSFGAFAGYFLDDDFRETINPFLDTTLEEEKLMLSEMCSSESEDDYSFEEGKSLCATSN